MKKIEKSERKLEELQRWLARTKVLKVVFMALIGLRFLPVVADAPAILTILPICLYFAIEETRILLESAIRIRTKNITKMEKGLKKEKSLALVFRRTNQKRKP
jgi:hypothetical protein